MYLTNIDGNINNMQDAINMAIRIFEYVDADPGEMQPLIRKGIVGPTMKRAREIADTSKKLHQYAQQAAADNDDRTFEELVESGEGLLILLCCDVAVTRDPAKLDSTWSWLRPAKK